jgi:hypothetical protein
MHGLQKMVPAYSKLPGKSCQVETIYLELARWNKNLQDGVEQLYGAAWR